MKKKFLRGEITTAFTVSILLGLTLFSLVSQYLIVRRQTTKTKAAESCESLSKNRIGDKPQGVIAGKDKKDQTGACNPGCCEFNGQCPNNQKCEIPNGYCQSGFSCNPATSMKQTCVNQQCVWQPCNGDDCQKNICTSHEQCKTSSSAPPAGGEGGEGNPSGGTVGSGVSNGCFSLRAEFEAKDENDKKAFYAWVTFESNRGGDVKLEEAGRHVAGWNGFSGGSFTYDPNWSQHHWPGSWVAVATLTKGQSYTVFYRGILSGCNPQDVSLSCNLVYNTNGSASVSGNGCSCRNCGSSYSPPSSATAAPTPQPTQPNQLTTAANASTSPSGATKIPTLPPGATKIPTLPPGATKIPTLPPGATKTLTPTNTPVPTIDTSNTQNIINTKGIISGEVIVNFGNELYKKIFEKSTTLNNFIQPVLIKENSGFLGIGKKIIYPKINITFTSQIGILKYSFEDIERFYGNLNRAKPNKYSLIIYKVDPYQIRNILFESKNFEFQLDQASINIPSRTLNLSNSFSEVEIRININNNVIKPVILQAGRPFYNQDGTFNESQDIKFNNSTVIKFIYFLEGFIGADRYTFYQFVWGCQRQNLVEPAYSTDPNLTIYLEGGKTYFREVNISCN